MGTPKTREPQEYCRNITEYKGPGRYIPITFLLYSWGSLFGIPIKVPLLNTQYIPIRIRDDCRELQFGMPHDMERNFLNPTIPAQKLQQEPAEEM